MVDIKKTVSDRLDHFEGIAKLALAFEQLNTNKADEWLEFYNADSDRDRLTGELQMVEKWHRLIHAKMKPK